MADTFRYERFLEALQAIAEPAKTPGGPPPCARCGAPTVKIGCAEVADAIFFRQSFPYFTGRTYEVFLCQKMHTMAVSLLADQEERA